MTPPPPHRLSELRRSRGWSMDELARRANTTASQINKLEKGRVRLTFDWMQRLARALECHPYELLPETPPSTLSDEERALIERYRGLSEQDRATVFKVTEAMAKPGRGD